MKQKFGYLIIINSSVFFKHTDYSPASFILLAKVHEVTGQSSPK